MKKRNIKSNIFLFACVAVLQLLWLPLGAIGFVCSMIAKIAEMAHEEMCILVDRIRYKF